MRPHWGSYKNYNNIIKLILHRGCFFNKGEVIEWCLKEGEMILEKNLKEDFLPFQQIEFAKVSPEAIRSILDRLEAEIETARVQKRISSVNRGLLQLGPSIIDLEI